jgi:cutinase
MKTSSSLISLLVLPLPVLSSPTPVIARQDSTTENGLTADSCKALTVIFARGTNEPGNVGDIAGPPFFSALRSDLGTDQVTVQGVDYGATIFG